MATDNFDPEIDDIGISPLEGILDDSGVFRLQTPNISSYNFDGFIGKQQLNIAASAVQPGMQISLTGSVGTQTYYTVLFVNDSDEELSASPSELVTIQYIDEDAFPQILSIGASAIISVQTEDWDNKYLGEKGWYIGTSGNAIFSNVAIRGEIEATTMDIGGAEGIVYDGNTVTIGSSVIINAALSVGASGNFIVSGSAAQDIISNNTTITGGNISTGNIKSTGYSGPGTGSAFSTKGMSINLDDGSIIAPNFKIDNGGNAHFKGIVQSASGAIGGFAVSASQISIAGFTMSTASGIFLGNNREFSVDTSGNLVARSASIIGNIIATSGSFTGALNAATGTFAGNLSAAGGTFSGTLSANSITSGTINASIISVTNLNADNISSGTITGRTFRSSASVNATSGTGVYLDASGNVRIANGGTSLTVDANKLVIQGSASFSGALVAAGGTFSGALSAATGTFSGTVSANNVTAGTLTGSTFRSSAGITATSGNGVYLDASGNVRFATTSASLQFNSGGLTVGGGTISGAVINGGSINGGSITGGTISGQSGNIGGFTLGLNSFTAGTNPNVVGILSGGTNAFFAGASDTAGTGAKFLVTNAGALTATNANITGAINATSGTFSGSLSSPTGTIGGFTIGETSLTGGTSPNISGISTGTNRFFANSSTTTGPGSSFNVTNTGVLTAVNANLSGVITASGGVFGPAANPINLISQGSNSVLDMGTIKMVANVTSGSRYGSLRFYETNGTTTVGELNTAITNKTWYVNVGSQNGLVLGTTSDFLYVPTSTPNKRGRYQGNGFEILGTDGTTNLLTVGGGTGAVTIGTSTNNKATTIHGSLTLSGGNLLENTNGDIRCFWSATSFIPFRINNGPSGTANIISPAIQGFAAGTGTAIVIDASDRLRKSSSTLKEKKNIEDYTPDINTILNIRPVLFHYKSQEDNENKVAGFIAEEIESLGLKEFVIYNSENLPEALNYGNMVAALIPVIKNQQNQINNLEQRIAKLEEKIGLI